VICIEGKPETNRSLPEPKLVLAREAKKNIRPSPRRHGGTEKARK